MNAPRIRGIPRLKCTEVFHIKVFELDVAQVQTFLWLIDCSQIHSEEMMSFPIVFILALLKCLAPTCLAEVSML